MPNANKIWLCDLLWRHFVQSTTVISCYVTYLECSIYKKINWIPRVLEIFSWFIVEFAPLLESKVKYLFIYLVSLCQYLSEVWVINVILNGSPLVFAHRIMRLLLGQLSNFKNLFIIKVNNEKAFLLWSCYGSVLVLLSRKNIFVFWNS